MKRIGAIFLLFIILTPTFGFCVHRHYCGDHLKEVNLFVDADESKCCGEFEEEFDCCKDEEFVYQLDVDYSANTPVTIPVNFNPLVFLVKGFLSVFTEDEHISFLVYKPPTLAKNIPILVQSFLI